MFYLFIIVPNALFSQQLVTINGSVNNLPNVNIKIQGTNYGTVTNKTGHYTLDVFLSQNPLSINYSRVGYRDTTVQINPNNNIEDTVTINITLKKTTYTLNELTVSAHSVFFQQNGAIADIEFINNVIIVLSNIFTKSEIEIINNEGKLLRKYYLKKKVFKYF